MPKSPRVVSEFPVFEAFRLMWLANATLYTYDHLRRVARGDVEPTDRLIIATMRATGWSIEELFGEGYRDYDPG